MKRIIALILSFVFCFTIFLPFRLSAHADALTAAMVASGAFAIGQSFGMTFTNAAWNSVGTMNMMEQEVQSYCGSRSIAEVFGREAMKAIGGKIVVGHVAYNAITNFLQNLAQKYNLGANRVGLGFMFADDYVDKNSSVPLSALNGWSLEINAGNVYWLTKWVGPDGKTSSTGGNDVPVNSYDPVQTIYSPHSNSVSAIVLYSNSAGATITRNHGYIYWSQVYPKASDRPTEVYGTSTGDIGSATVLNPGYGWAGEVHGYEGPDTNLDQLMGQIFEDVADTNLDVDGEVIPLDPPGPEPTPAPGIDEIIGGLDDANETLTGIDTNLDDLYQQGLEEIGTIGDARDAITEAVGDQTGALEGAIGDQTGALEGAIADNAGVVSGAIDQAVSDVGSAIGTQTGVISGAIDQAVSDVQTAIGEQTAALDESLSATAEGVETIAEAIEDEEINWQKFDLKGLFPFCIPFDIYNMLKALDASPTAPHVQIPFVIQSIGFSYTLDLDFSAFDPVAAIMRQMELICYGLALAWATSKVIKW